MWRSINLSFSGIVLASVLSACSLDLNPKIEIPQIPGLTTPPLTCSAMLAPSAGSYAVSGEAAPIQVKASGGTGPYAVVGTAIGFSAETVISRTYTNSTSSNIFVVDTVQVSDHVGAVKQCNFLVTVAPAGQSSTLACAFVATPASPTLNQNTTFVATASGGTAPYTFSNFNLSTDGTVVTSFAANSATTASGVGKYSSIGTRTATAKLKDNAGTEIVCSAPVNVVAAPAVAAVVTPATSVVAGSPITINASSTGFSSVPAYSFSTTRAGVSISTAGNVATVTSSSVQSAFDVVVTATAGAQTASYTVSLAFTSAGTLACQIVTPTGTLYTGADVEFRVEATSSSDPLLVTYFSTHSDGVVSSQTDSTRKVKYSVSGLKTVVFQAKSKTTGALCQSGSAMSALVEIAPANNGGGTGTLTCTGYTSVNPSYRNEWFYAWANITGPQGGWVDEIAVTKDGVAAAHDGYWYNNNTAVLKLFNQGSYQLKFKIKDWYGRTGECTTTQVVSSIWY